MTEKIVQLIDKDNNNLYPVAGSLKSGSVTTSTISDGAVTNAKIAPSISQVEISFHILNPAVRTGTGQATLIRLPGDIGILTYNGTTGFNDSGTGDRQINVHLDNAGFDSILGGSQTSWYALNPGAYQTYSRAFLTPGGDARIDNYVYKDTAIQQERMISFVIIGTLGS